MKISHPQQVADDIVWVTAEKEFISIALSVVCLYKTRAATHDSLKVYNTVKSEIFRRVGLNF